MNERLLNLQSRTTFPSVLWVLVLSAVLFVSACGSDAQQTGAAVKYPTGIGEDVEQQLRYDSRVESFEPGDENLVIHVNDAWVNSPPGMRERTLGQWYSSWASRGKTSRIIVEYEGNEVDGWSAEKGYQPATHKAQKS
jgi:hypothetical protein